jgi:hypothetical protein
MALRCTQSRTQSFITGSVTAPSSSGLRSAPAPATRGAGDSTGRSSMPLPPLPVLLGPRRPFGSDAAVASPPAVLGAALGAVLAALEGSSAFLDSELAESAAVGDMAVAASLAGCSSRLLQPPLPSASPSPSSVARPAPTTALDIQPGADRPAPPLLLVLLAIICLLPPHSPPQATVPRSPSLGATLPRSPRLFPLNATASARRRAAPADRPAGRRSAARHPEASVRCHRQRRAAGSSRSAGFAR